MPWKNPAFVHTYILVVQAIAEGQYLGGSINNHILYNSHQHFGYDS